MKKMVVVLILFLAAHPASASTLFLRLAGPVGTNTPSQLLTGFARRVVEPLTKGTAFTRQSYVANVDGYTSFHFNFIVEAAEAGSEAEFQNYVKTLEGQDFHGVTIHFEKVTGLSEIAALQVGQYEAQRDDPFAMNFQIQRKFQFASLREWLDFSNAYGFALLSPNHGTFMNYLDGFLNDIADFKNVNRVLAQNNMVAIDPRVSVILADGTVIPSDMEHSPFLPFKFFRNCFQPDFETGNCAK